MHKKGQSFIEIMVAFAIILFVALMATGITNTFFGELNGYLVFLGYLFLLCGIVFSFLPNMNAGMQGIAVGGAVCAVFFLLAWLVPKISAIKLFP